MERKLNTATPTKSLPKRTRNNNKNEIKPMDFFKILMFSSLFVFFLVTFIIAGSTPESTALNFPLQKNQRIFEGDKIINQNQGSYNNSCSPWPNCMLPPREPSYSPLCELLQSWSPNDANIEGYEKSSANQFNHSPLPRFDFTNEEEYNVAMKYREVEIPFLVYNVPELDKTMELWSDSYLRSKFSKMDPHKHQYSIDRSTKNGHLLYFSKGSSKRVRGYIPPQEHLDTLRYEDFEQIAIAADHPPTAEKESAPPNKKMEEDSIMYLTISAAMGAYTDWIVNALSYFRDDNKFFRVNFPEDFHGVNCRFGMKGIVQAAHYDHGRNFISLIKGHRRYIILHPRECRKLELLGKSSPSSRHASFDWADPNELTQRQKGGKSRFCEALATEIVLKEGETLYLPSYWFHYIVSLDRTIQCNSRSGFYEENNQIISSCMAMDTVSKATGY